MIKNLLINLSLYKQAPPSLIIAYLAKVPLANPFNLVAFNVFFFYLANSFLARIMPGQKLSVLPVGDIESEYKNSDEYQAKLAEKFKMLEECVPNLKGLDTISMLEEAKKYVEYLDVLTKAVKAAMPSHSTRAYPPAQTSNGGTIDPFAPFRKMSGNELQLIINSPKVQQELSSSGIPMFAVYQPSKL